MTANPYMKLLLGLLLGLPLVFCACDGSETETTPTGAAKLSGPADSLAREAIKDAKPGVYPDEPGDVSDRRVYTVVQANATVAQINAALAKMGARKIVGALKAGGLLIIEVEPGTADATAAKSYPGLVGVAVDVRTTDDLLAPAHNLTLEKNAKCSRFNSWSWKESAHDGGVTDWSKQGFGSGSWGLKHVRAPFLWNLRASIKRRNKGVKLRAGVVDMGFHPHIDSGGLNYSDDAEIKKRKIKPTEHGLNVWSVIGAAHNKEGVEGAFPNYPDDKLLEPQAIFAQRWSSDELHQIADLITRDVKVINYSRGFGDKPELAGKATEGGPIWKEVINNLASGNRQFLVFCSAGNGTPEKGPRRHVRANSPCANASTLAGATRILSVEALAAGGGALASFSHDGGTIAAPGECLGVAKKGDKYRTINGTSFSAPLTAGGALTLWALAPKAGHAEIRKVLLDGAFAAVGGSARRLNLWGALQRLDTPARGILRDLADVDDGTVDGNLRLAPPGVPTDYDRKIHTDDGMRGDGCVDMSDLRAVRDAILHASGNAAGLDGAELHPKRDLNGDGHHAHKPAFAVRDAADRERHWSRFDLDANLTVDAGDLTTLAEQWGKSDDKRCKAPFLQGVSKSQVESLQVSADIWVKIDPKQRAQIEVGRGGGQAYDPAGPPPKNMVGDWLLFTARGDCDPKQSFSVSVCKTATKGGVTSRGCEKRVVKAGEDARFDVAMPAVTPGGQAFYSQHRNDNKNPVKLTYHKGSSDFKDAFDIPGSAWETLSQHNRYVRDPDTQQVFYPNCNGGQANAPSDCFTIQQLRTGATRAIKPTLATAAKRYRVREWRRGGRLLIEAEGIDFNINNRLFIADTKTFGLVEIGAGIRKKEARLAPNGTVLFNGGLPGDKTSNGIYRVTTGSIISGKQCLPFGREKLSDVFRAVVDTKVHGPRSLVLTNPFGKQSPGLRVASLDLKRGIELGPRADFAAFSPDGRYVVFGAINGGSTLVELGAGDAWDDPKQLKKTKLGDFAGSIRWSIRGDRFFVVDDGGNIWGERLIHYVHVSSLSAPKSLGKHEVGGGPPVWSPDGSNIAAVRWVEDTLSCVQGQDKKVRHLDIVVIDPVTEKVIRLTKSLAALYSPEPQCGATYPTDEWNVSW